MKYIEKLSSIIISKILSDDDDNSRVVIGSFIIAVVFLTYAHLANLLSIKHDGREVGFFSAVNWWFFFFPGCTLFLYLFQESQATLRSAMRTAEDENAICKNGTPLKTPGTGERFAGEIIDASKSAIYGSVGIILLCSVVVGLWQWYNYSAQWYFFGWNEESFAEQSSGADWNVGWVISSIVNPYANLFFGLLCYEYYALVFTIMFALYFYVLALIINITKLSHRKNYTLENMSGAKYRLDLQRLFWLFVGSIYVGIASFWCMAVRSLYLKGNIQVSDDLMTSFVFGATEPLDGIFDADRFKGLFRIYPISPFYGVSIFFSVIAAVLLFLMLDRISRLGPILSGREARFVRTLACFGIVSIVMPHLGVFLLGVIAAVVVVRVAQKARHL